MTHTRFASTLLAVTLVVAGCSGDDDADPAPSSSTPDTSASTSTTSDPGAASGPITIMPLGDSLTEGDDARDPAQAQSYRGHLHAMLVEAGYDVDFVGSGDRPAVGDLPDDPDADHEGHGGFTIGPDDYVVNDQGDPGNIDAYLDEWLAEPPDVILLLIGVNDLFDDDRPVDPTEADDKLTAIVERIGTLAPDAEIVVGSYPPVSFFMDFDNPETRPGAEAFADLNAAASAVGAASDDDGVHYAPILESLEDSWGDADVISDGLHPSPEGAEKLARVWFEALAPILDQM